MHSLSADKEAEQQAATQLKDFHGTDAAAEPSADPTLSLAEEGDDAQEGDDAEGGDADPLVADAEVSPAADDALAKLMKRMPNITDDGKAAFEAAFKKGQAKERAKIKQLAASDSNLRQ